MEQQSEGFYVEKDSQGHYQDVSSEEELVILSELKTTAWQSVVATHFANSRPWLYKIIVDQGRSVFLDVLQIRDGGKYLDIGSGWGQVTIPLSRRGDVFCLDQTTARLNILREIARQERASLNYICGNFLSFPFRHEQFDLVILNGSLEYMGVGTKGAPIYDVQNKALEKVHTLLKPGGVVYIGIENALGLKYLFGAPDDHTGIKHSSYLNEPEAVEMAKKTSNVDLRIKTWSLAEYQQMLSSVGFVIEQTYGCFPDYKIIREMIPLEHVDTFVCTKEIPVEHSGVDGSVLPENDSIASVYKLLAKNKIAQYFCPSYAFIGRKQA